VDLGIEYDDNVPLRASSGGGPRASTRLFTSLFAASDLIGDNAWTLRAEGSATFGRNLRRALDDYDQVSAEAILELIRSMAIADLPARLSARVSALPAWRDSHRYGETVGLTSSAVVNPSDRTLAYVYHAVSRLNLVPTALDPDNDRQDAVQNALGATFYVYGGGREGYAALGYSRLWNAARGNDFDFTADRLTLTGSAPLDRSWRIDGKIEWIRRRYSHFGAEPGFRASGYSESLWFSRPLGDRGTVTVGFSRQDDAASDPRQRFGRNLLNVTWTYRF
jgi:hypothetical protein